MLSDWDDLPLQPGAYAAHVAISSLPHLLDPEGRAIAGAATLVADGGRTAHWARYLAALRPGARHIGLVWAGKPEHPNDRRRSLALADVVPIVVAAPDALFVSLNKNRSANDAAMLEANAILDVADALPDFSETAALVAALDLLVTIDSSPAHLGGALGVSTWMLTPMPADWRWGVAGKRSRWYDSLRIFRQDTPGDWGGPITRVRDEVAGGAAPRTSAGAA